MTEAKPKSALRSVFAVLAGLIVIVVLSNGADFVLHATGVYPPFGQPMRDSLFILATAYRLVFAVAGCYLTALLAPNRPMQHALALGIIGVILAIVGTVATWNAGPEFGPKWYPILLVLTALPCAWLGGKLGSGHSHTN